MTNSDEPAKDPMHPMMREQIEMAELRGYQAGYASAQMKADSEVQDARRTLSRVRAELSAERACRQDIVRSVMEALDQRTGRTLVPRGTTDPRVYRYGSDDEGR